MLFTKIIFPLFTFTTLFATNILQRNYYVNNDCVMLSDIVHVNKKNDKKLFSIDKYRHIKRIQKKELLYILKKNGYSDYTSKHNYIQFTKRSPINTSAIKEHIKSFYKEKYNNITISQITVTPTHYLETLPKHYSIHLNKKAYLLKKGLLSIRTDDKKKIFFKYEISATLPVLVARKNIKKDTELNNLNTRKNSIILNRFHAMPLQELHRGKYQCKYNLKSGMIITKREVTGLYLVKRGSTVGVSLTNNGINIYFSAKALRNGRLGDTIDVRQQNGKKIKVLIVGKNKAEVQ